MDPDRSFRLEFVPFDDDAESYASVMRSLGRSIDCLVSAHASGGVMQACGFLPLGTSYACRIGIPYTNPLATRLSLDWDDLDGQTILLIRLGISTTVDRIREEIAREHPRIKVVDANGPYDVEAFNLCVREGWLMEAPEPWEGIHPVIKFVPMDWNYGLRHGIACAQRPSSTMTDFLGIVGAKLADKPA